MIKLYSYFRSTAAYRVRIALNLKELEYKIMPVHLVKDGGQQHSKAYAKHNPQSLVPTLIDNNITITQSLAIIEYLDEKYPSPSLLPESLQAKAWVRSLSNIIACDVHPLNNLRVLQFLKNELSVSDDQKLNWYHHWIKLGFKAFESILAKEERRERFCYGDMPTMADACLIPQIYNANRFKFPMSDFPRLMAINEHCLSLPAFKQASPENQPDAE